MSLLKANELALGYDGKVVVDNLNFEINMGDYLCIVGENGSGKSTLMKTILGLKRPMGGELILGDGFNSKHIGYLPQQTVVQKDFPASVWEIVLSGMQNSSGLNPFYTKEQKKTALDNIEKMGIMNLKKRCYRELSGGQQQRVLLARALCATHNMLLLDEPVAGLDPKVTNEMYEVINSLNKEGITIVMVSHDVHVALHYATKILHVCDTSEYYESSHDYLKSDCGKMFIGCHDKAGNKANLTLGGEE